ncbi:MAG: hypothetical protein EBS96_14630 [Spartobacteria bacterium]|nr:hypothetical protein [Spartobacteria bacterium]
MPSESGSSGRLNLPPGLILSANGTISGTPTKGGSFDTYPRVTDANGKETIKQLTIVLIDSTFAIVGDGISNCLSLQGKSWDFLGGGWRG